MNTKRTTRLDAVRVAAIPLVLGIYLSTKNVFLANNHLDYNNQGIERIVRDSESSQVINNSALAACTLGSLAFLAATPFVYFNERRKQKNY